MSWQQQQQQPPPQQHNQQQQQQTVTMTSPMMPTTAFYMSSGGNVSLQHNAVVSPMGYVTAVPTVRDHTIAETYLSRQSMGLGITLIIIGVLTSIFNGVGFAVSDELAPVGHGFWCGALFIVTGVFGIVAANKQKCLIVTFMVLSIKSAIITVVLLGFGIGGAFANTCSNYYYYNNCWNSSDTKAAIAMESLQAILAVVAAIVSIWGSAICCRAVCCCGSVYSSVVAAPYGNQQVMIISQQQQQPAGAVQYARPQMMPMAFSSSAYPPQYANQQPPQYWTSGPPTQPEQQQQYYASNPQQPSGYVFAASSNVDQMPWTAVGHPSSVDNPPAYNASFDNKGTPS